MSFFFSSLGEVLDFHSKSVEAGTLLVLAIATTAYFQHEINVKLGLVFAKSRAEAEYRRHFAAAVSSEGRLFVWFIPAAVIKSLWGGATPTTVFALLLLPLLFMDEPSRWWMVMGRWPLLALSVATTASAALIGAEQQGGTAAADIPSAAGR